MNIPEPASSVPAAVAAAQRRHAAALRSYVGELFPGDAARASQVLDEVWRAYATAAEAGSEESPVVWLFAEARRHVAAQRGTVTGGNESAVVSATGSLDGRLAELTPKQREVLGLKFRHGFRLSGIARILDLSPAMAARLLHHALGRLAPAFSKEGAAVAGTDDPRLTLAAIGELDDEETKAWAASRPDPAALNQRLQEIRQTAEWVSLHLSGGVSPSSRPRSPRRRRVVLALVVVVLVAGAWFWQSTPSEPVPVGFHAPERRTSVSARQPGVSSRPAVVAPTAEPAVGGSGSGVPSTAAAATGWSLSPVLALTVKPEVEVIPRSAGAPMSGNRGQSGAVATATGLHTGSGGAPFPAASGNHTPRVEAIDATTVAPITALKRALGAGNWPRPADVNRAALLRYFVRPVAQPAGAEAFELKVEAAELPWTPGELAVRVTATARPVPSPPRPSATLILLLDTSESMAAPNRLPLVQETLATLLDRLQPHDRVGIVTYAGEAQVLHQPQPAGDAAGWRAELQALDARGLTNGGAGIEAAFALAARSSGPGESPLVILCTDGEFNVGLTDAEELAEFVRHRTEEDGVRLAVFGFGRTGPIDPRLALLAAEARGGSGHVNTRADAVSGLLAQLGDLLPVAAAEVRLAIGTGGTLHAVAEADRVLPGETVGEVVVLTADAVVQAHLGYRAAGTMSDAFREVRLADVRVTAAEAGADFRFAVAVARWEALLRGGPEATTAGEWTELEDWVRAQVEEDGGYRAELLTLIGQARQAAGR